MTEIIERPNPINLAEIPTLPSPLQALERIFWNYWWSWSAEGAGVFRDLDTEVWDECEHNPRALLERVSPYRLAEMATDPVYIERVRRLAEQFDHYLAATGSENPKLHISEFKSQILDSGSKPPDNSTITPAHPVAHFWA